MVSLMEHELESACEAFASSSTLPVSLSDFWTTVLNGTIKTMFGKYGNSDPLNFDDWIELESETLSTFAQAALYNSQDRQCENMVTSLNLDIMYANTGEEEILNLKSCPRDCGSVSIRGDIETRPE